MITLISGVWLRLQWGWPEWMLFRADYLLHGHSHVALLGWIFLGLSGLLLETGTRRSKLPLRILTLLGVAIALLTAVLFVAFADGGYNPVSIALSTLHMLLGYGIAWIFFRYAKQDSYVTGQYFMEGAVFWMVIATAGTWLLAIGRGLPPFWLDSAVTFYLHILFNGWFVFALAGLAYRYLISPEKKETTWPFWLMMAGLLPSLITQLDFSSGAGSIEESAFVTATGIAGTFVYGAGGLAVIWFVIRSSIVKKNRWECRELLWTGVTGAILVFTLPMAMAWPSVREIWLMSDFLVIGFIHLHLLLTISSLLLFALIQRMAGSGVLYNGHPGSRKSRDVPYAKSAILSHFPAFYIIRRAGSLIYITGCASMIGVLFVTGIWHVSGVIPPFPVQKTLFYTGLTTLAGVLILLLPVGKRFRM